MWSLLRISEDSCSRVLSSALMFVLCSQAEHLEGVWVLSFHDALCEGMGFERIREKIRQGLTERLGVLYELCASL